MQGNLKKHINSEQVKNMFQCEECDETFGSRSYFIDGNGALFSFIRTKFIRTSSLTFGQNLRTKL